MPIKESIQKELETLTEKQLEQIADFIAFVKFRDRRDRLRENQSKLAELYKEFTEEDRLLAEQGMDEFAEMLRKLD